ncbi:MAG TPA: CPBP family intramembrane glutamic endopeptidase [Gemmatimonadales bacterium]|nr:CPBP family intramembrane glutamic endopeptidase [Gemmatimonadales bacterium]
MSASVLQSAFLVALAVWGGVALAPNIGLQAPAFEAAAARQPIWPVLKPQLVPGAIAGVLGGLFLLISLRLAPGQMSTLQAKLTPPVYARVLYGGITEELLLRWGLMTAFAWLAWRFLQARRGSVRPSLLWLAIATSAILFGVGHLPVASFLLGSLTPPIVGFVLGVNATFGVLFGWLYWRRGLETAILAHAMTHLVNAGIAAFA